MGSWFGASTPSADESDRCCHSDEDVRGGPWRRPRPSSRETLPLSRASSSGLCTPGEPSRLRGKGVCSPSCPSPPQVKARSGHVALGVASPGGHSARTTQHTERHTPSVLSAEWASRAGLPVNLLFFLHGQTLCRKQRAWSTYYVPDIRTQPQFPRRGPVIVHARQPNTCQWPFERVTSSRIPWIYFASTSGSL